MNTKPVYQTNRFALLYYYIVVILNKYFEKNCQVLTLGLIFRASKKAKKTYFLY